MEMKGYSELSALKTFKERFDYLKLDGVIGHSTFGSHRYLNQALYTSPEWKKVRNKVIIRDNGCDLGIAGREISGKIYIHHIIPISPEDVVNRSPLLFSLDNLICTSQMTHEAIHYGDESLLFCGLVERKPNDTSPWRK